MPIYVEAESIRAVYVYLLLCTHVHWRGEDADLSNLL
jgi:hypothetical protein